jgi:hypothetical protein
MKRLLIPCQENQYHPFLIRTPLLAIYLVFIFLFNIIFVNFNLTTAQAAVDFTSLYNLHNKIRSENGLSPLGINSLLINSAQAKADAMLESDCWSHYCPDGKSPWEFFDSAGYLYAYAGENLAEGFNDNNAVMNAWMNSPTHKDNILNPQFNEIGISFAYGNFQGINNNTIVVVHFGSRFIEGEERYIPEAESETAPNLTIDNPKNGDIFADPDFEISGKANDLSEVELYSNGALIGRVASEGDNYTYRSPESFRSEKEYLLQAKANDPNSGLITSNIVSFQMDFTPPEITLDNIAVANDGTEQNPSYLVSISNVSAESLIEINLNKQFQYLGKNNWQCLFSISEIADLSNISLLASDLAGNSSKLDISKEVLANKAANNTGIPDLGAYVNNPRLQINVTFSIFLSILFGLDFYMLNKTGNTGKVKSKSHLNFIVFVIILILSLLTNMDGSILTGISS